MSSSSAYANGSTHSSAHSHPISLSRPLLSPASTPFMTPQGSMLNVPQMPPTRRRLLMPTIRRISESGSPKPSFMKPSATKFGRSRSGSASANSPPDSGAGHTCASDLLSLNCKLEIVEDPIEMEGYQIYAVEKWVVERTRPVTVLAVYTGDPTHKITVTALAPQASLTPTESQIEWDKALQLLKKEGARPKETEKGVLMVTSLANFRSDFTIVQIPAGNILEVWEQLYTNINLLRMGCSGRSALTLQEPSDTTKDRFFSMYYIHDKVRSKELFNATVLELVKFIQCGLAIFGMFDLSLERNGLLCDVTVDGIQRWITEVGEPCLHVEASERLADPSIVSALLSLVITMRNKLYDIGFGQVVPRDPFLEPLALVNALTGFHNSRNNNPSSSSLKFASESVIEALNTAHDRFRQTESFKVHRVLKNKLDDLTTDLRAAPSDSLGSSHSLGATTDLNAFVKAVVGGGKDGAVSLRYLWSGRPMDIHKKRQEKVQSDGEKEEDFDSSRFEKIDGKSTDDDEFMNGRQWSGRMQRKIGAWTAIGRNKKMSVDFGSKGWSWAQPAEPISQPDETPTGPTVIVSGEEEDPISSGQASPIWDQHTAASSTFGLDRFKTVETALAGLSEYERKVTEFNQKRPQLRYSIPQRIVTWSDPLSMRGMTRVPSQLGRSDSSAGTERSWDNSTVEVSVIEDGDHSRRKPLINLRAHRRKSFSDVDTMRGARILPLDRMKIDVELCGQLLIMRRREAHLQNAIICLREITSSLSSNNSHLREEYQAHSRKLGPFLDRGSVINDIESARIKADSITQETNALRYEAEQFRVGDLWNLANPPRRKVLEVREKVFGTGRRLPQGVSGAHGRFNRLQRTLDGEYRLIDYLGRTESEVEEESDLEDVIPSVEDVDEGDVVEHAQLKPTWLLTLFRGGVRRWGGAGASKKTDEPSKSPPQTASPPSPVEGFNTRNFQTS